MDKIQTLKARRQALKEAGTAVRSQIAALVDADSFVELSAFSFSKDAFYGAGAEGEGIVAGFATVGGDPFYVIAQNFEEHAGGLTHAGCLKMEKTMRAAEKSGTPVIYLLHSHGVRIGEGIPVLEGISGVLTAAAALKGKVLQFALLDGEVYGSSALLASLADVVLFTEGSVLSLGSPFVRSAKAGKSLKPEEVGGFAAIRTPLPALKVSGMKEAASRILAISDLLSLPVVEAELNDPLPALNGAQTSDLLASLLEGSVELGANVCPEVKTVLCRVGGISAAAVLFDNALLGGAALSKLNGFHAFAEAFGLPILHFVDVKGVECSLSQEAEIGIEAAKLLTFLAESETPKLSVITGSAVGVGYSLLAAKSAGYDYTVALATAKIALFDDGAGEEITGTEGEYYEALHADPFNAAREGYLDDIVEPQYLKQYLVSALQMLLR